jgi:hypothetical protein
VAHYLFNDDATDSLGDYDGTWSGTETYVSSFTGMGKAASFNGSGSYINIGTVSVTQDTFSYAAWFNMSGNNAWQAMSLVGPNDWNMGHGEIVIVADNSYPYYVRWNAYGLTDAPVDSGRIISDGEWHHAVVTYDGESSTLYVDGELIGSQAAVGVWNGPWYLGYIGAFIGERHFNGLIDDVRIYSRVLTEEEIAELAAGTEAE